VRAAHCSTRHTNTPIVWDPLARVFDAWGFDRCLWGTDWTPANAVVNYEQAVEPFLKTDRLSDSERAMLMGGACAKAYRWSPGLGSPSAGAHTASP
jgi:L-fuconolactonase